MLTRPSASTSTVAVARGKVFIAAWKIFIGVSRVLLDFGGGSSSSSGDNEIGGDPSSLGADEAWGASPRGVKRVVVRSVLFEPVDGEGGAGRQHRRCQRTLIQVLTFSQIMQTRAAKNETEREIANFAAEIAVERRRDPLRDSGLSLSSKRTRVVRSLMTKNLCLVIWSRNSVGWKEGCRFVWESNNSRTSRSARSIVRGSWSRSLYLLMSPSEI